MFSCVLFQSIDAVGLHLRFKEHLLLQTLSACYLLYYAGEGCCTVVIKECDTWSLNCAFDDIAKALNDVSRGILQVIFMGCLPMEKLEGFTVSDPCLRLFAFCHLYFGLATPSHVIWLMERGSRFAFIRSLDPSVNRKLNIKHIHRIEGLMWFCHGFASLSMLAFCWKLSIVFPGLISQFGSSIIL